MITLPIKCIAGDRWLGPEHEHVTTERLCGAEGCDRQTAYSNPRRVRADVLAGVRRLYKARDDKFAEIIKSAAITAE